MSDTIHAFDVLKTAEAWAAEGRKLALAPSSRPGVRRPARPAAI